MTEGPLQDEKSMCVRVWLEVGHACEPRQSALGRALALDWRVWVRGAAGQDISAFVHKVVFHLHPASAFVYPKRVIQEPPYEIQESGSASIEIPIHVYLKDSCRPRRIRLRYNLRVESAARRSRDSRSVFYDVENPSEPLWRALVRGGGEVVARTDSRAAAGAADRLLVLLPDAKPAPAPRPRPRPRRVKQRRAPPAPSAPDPKPVLNKCKEDPCGAGAGAGSGVVTGKCSAAVGAALRRQLVAAALTPDEATRVWRLCAAVARYERSPGALPLPPLGDPIYRLPEPPPSLRAALSSVESDLANAML